MLNKDIKKRRGFTLIELIVSIFVMIVGIIGAYAVAQYPLSQVSNSINRLQAAYLAQEGIEIVRNIRDTNWIEEEEWDNGIRDKCTSGNDLYCYPDYDDLELKDENITTSEDLPPLNLGNQFYTNDAGSDTKFTRRIQIDEEGEALKVVVEVLWSSKGKDYSFDLQENLYNWWNN